MHRGVGVFLRSENRCYIQQKDNTYPIEKWRGAHSLWGGAQEAGETELDSAYRELSEELFSGENCRHLGLKFIKTFVIKSDHDFEYSLFECRLSKKDFESLIKQQVNEGIGKTFNINKLMQLNWIWNLETMIQDYLESHT